MPGLLNALLPYVYSQSDRLKRHVGGLLSDPRGTLEQTAGGLLDAHRGQQNLLAQAFADPGQPFKMTDPNAMQAAAMNMLAGPLGVAPAGMLSSFHGDVLASMAKGVPDDVVDAAFGANGYVYHTPYRPFENAQQTAIGMKASPLGERLFSTAEPLSAKAMRSIEAVPVSDSASGAFAKELADEGAMSFLNKDGQRFSVITPSAKNSGQFQATQYDPKGAIGDSQHLTWADAVQRLIDSGYSKILDEKRAANLLDRVMLSK